MNLNQKKPDWANDLIDKYCFLRFDDDSLFFTYLKELGLSKKECIGHPVIFQIIDAGEYYKKPYYEYKMVKLVYIDNDGNIYEKLPENIDITDLYVYGTSTQINGDNAKGISSYHDGGRYSSSYNYDEKTEAHVINFEEIPILQYKKWNSKDNNQGYSWETWAEPKEIPANVKKAIENIDKKIM